MKILCSIFLTIAAFAGCNKAPDTLLAATMTNKDTTAGSLTYLALGDSYTIGEAVPNGQAFPYQLVARLDSQGYKFAVPNIIAVTGWTTDDLIDAISKSDIHTNHYNIVTLLIGVNDQYQGLSQDNYRIKFQQLLNDAISFAGGNVKHVFVLSIPDYGVTPFASGQDGVIGPQIDQFNAINKSISTAAGVNYLDITPTSRQAANDLSLIANDGLHPSGKMYALWVELLEPMIKSAGIGH